MNKEQWDKHHKVMEWFYAEKNRKLLMYTPNGSWNPASTPTWVENIIYIPNDEYVEFRKAQVEGKTVQRLIELDNPRYVDDNTGVFYSECSYRIKPDEPKFKIGDWVIPTHKTCIPEIADKTIFELKHENDFIKWEPQEGDIVVCWDDKMYCRLIGKIRKSAHGLHLEENGTDDLTDYDNCVPYIGQPFDQMK